MTAPPPPFNAEPAVSSGSPPSWAADMSEADPAPLQAAAAMPPEQLALFHPDDLAPASVPARSRRTRLPGRIKALLTKPAKPDAAPAANSSWPDSFFDEGAAS